MDDAQEIRERERDLLMCHPCIHSSLTGGPRTSVTDIKEVKVKP
jgi:hypothetical protein